MTASPAGTMVSAPFSSDVDIGNARARPLVRVSTRSESKNGTITNIRTIAEIGGVRLPSPSDSSA